MKWAALFRRIGRMPLRISQHEDVYALLQTEPNGEMEKVYLEIKWDAKGCPYLIQSKSFP